MRGSRNMNLTSAFRLPPSSIVAFIGGGGKTTAMFRLARELVQAGASVVTTTTTRIFAAQIGLAPIHFEADSALPSGVEAALAETRHVLVTGRLQAGSGKAPGVPVDLIDQLRRLPGNPTILIEADGSRMRPFKAPAEHEPVIPHETTLVVPVIGADVFGEPLDAEHVHRADVVQVLTGAMPGVAVTPALAAAIIAHPAGGLKGVPAAARVIPLINKAESPQALAAARETARLLLGHERIDSVVLGAVAREAPVVEVWGRVAAIVLAAGRSTRMGTSKQLLAWQDGQTMLGRVVRQLQDSGVSEVIVVTGAERQAVEDSLRAQAAPDGAPVRFAFNPDFAGAEMARSLQAGLGSLSTGAAAALVVLADQPHVPASVTQALLQRWRGTQAQVVAPFYQGQRGHPLLFDRAAWDGLRALPAGANPREFLRTVAAIEAVEVDTDSIVRDIDTPEQYARERKL